MPRTWQNQTVLELVGLYVHPEHKREGIGSALMAQFETETAAANRRGLWVLSQNHSAIEFYRSLGYEVSGETKKMISSAMSLLKRSEWRRRIRV